MNANADCRFCHGSGWLPVWIPPWPDSTGFEPDPPRPGYLPDEIYGGAGMDMRCPCTGRLSFRIRDSGRPVTGMGILRIVWPSGEEKEWALPQEVGS